MATDKRLVTLLDQWLTDPVTGSVVGVLNRVGIAVTESTWVRPVLDVSGNLTGFVNPSTGATLPVGGSAVNLTGPITSVGAATSVASQTGTGSTFVMNTSPTLVAPALGTPTSVNLNNATGLPLATGVNGILAISNGGTSANTSTGTGSVVLANSPALVTPNIGAATASNITATGAITSAGQVHGAIVNTANATVSNATLTAASMVAGVITRSGSTAAYSDTTDTAAAIVAAIVNAQVGTSFDLTIINTVAFAETIVAGTGVTLVGTTSLAASSTRRFIGTITNVGTPAVTLTGISSGTL